MLPIILIVKRLITADAAQDADHPVSVSSFASSLEVLMIIDCTDCSQTNCPSWKERKMDKCPTTIPTDSASAGRPNEVRYDLQDGKGDIIKADILAFQGIDPEVSNPISEVIHSDVI